MKYIGEHLWLGNIGHLIVIIGVVASFLSTFFYFYDEKEGVHDKSWKHYARLFFSIQVFSVFSTIFLIFFAMIKKYYEYNYVWAHVGDELPFKYIFAAFWEGQEGSFLLWMFWHAVLGIAFIITEKKWESPVLAVLSSVQMILFTMLLGTYFNINGTEFKIGSSPFALIRDVMNAPIFQTSDYLSKITGNGLNPLLQNYWMTIHPPTLFLGFGSTIIPFCFAVAGLWRKNHTDWLRPALKWTMFSAGVLGLGILMGGAWAYEALSFGGYWAWDPVENMSLVPWLILLAGLHSNIIAIKTGQSLKATYIFYLLTFITVIYSTFLTRSGVLGDSSVHAFTEMGLEWQLIILLSTYVGIAIFSFIRSYNSIPKIEKEENTWSREFWMFIGSLVLLFSAVLITFTTSIPVYNKLGKLVGLDLNLSPPLDPIAHYNKFQLWIAVFISTLSSLAMYLRFRGMGTSAHLKTVVTRLTIILLIASAFTVLTLQALNATAWQYIVLLLSAWFGILANLDFLFFFGKKKFHSLPTALSHFGFSVMIVGILFSGLNKEFISTNNFAQKGLIEGFTDDNYKRNILLLKDLPMLMNKYEVTYKSDTVVNHTRSFNINYLQKDKNGKILEDFSLSPTVIYDKSFTKIAASNPSTYRMWDKDIFTHIASLPKEELDIEYAREQEDSLKYNTLQVALNQSVIDSNYTITLLDIVENPTHKSYNPSPEDLAIGVKLAIKAKDNDSTFYAYPMLALRGESLLFYPDQINQLLVKFKLPEQFFEKAFTDENSLKYTNFKLKKGDSFKFEGEEYHFQLLTQEVKHPHYIKKEGDIVVGALITNTEGDTIQPIYLIRNNEQFNLKFELRKKGLHFRFMHIDPKDETIDIAVAHKDNADIKFPIAIAENIRRSDYVVLEAIVFPGINLFWIGSTLMMVGLFLAWWKKKKKGEQV